MKVEIDTMSGFCFGVVNAISLAEKSLAEGRRVYCLGDIVHNRVEMERLERIGLRTACHAELEGMRGATVLIRAHGEPPSTYQIAKNNAISIIDATCPVVAALQKTVVAAHSQMTAAGGQVVILGKKGHAEVVGLTGQVEGGAPVIVVEGLDDLCGVDPTKPVYLLSQTTQSLSLFGRVSDALRQRAAEVAGGAGAEGVEGADAEGADAEGPDAEGGAVADEVDAKAAAAVDAVAEEVDAKAGAAAVDAAEVIVHDTVCRRVANREPHLRDFAAQHDVVIFVCGRKSSNGRLLYEVCRSSNPHSYMVEDETELRPEWFLGARSAGVCGATSTPRWIMERVADRVEQIGR